MTRWLELYFNEMSTMQAKQWEFDSEDDRSKEDGDEDEEDEVDEEDEEDSVVLLDLLMQRCSGYAE